MNPSSLIPTPDPIPVHWGWFQVFLLLTALVHFLIMNTMLGSGIIALISSVRGSRSDLKQAREISTKLPMAIAFTINLGVAPLLFIQVLYGHFFYTSSVLMAAYWISIIPILILAYYGAYIYDFKFDALGSLRIVFIAAVVLLFLFIGFLFSSNATLMLTPEKWGKYVSTGTGTALRLFEPSLIFRYLHFVLASTAIGGLSLSLLSTTKYRKGDMDAEQTILLGMKWFTHSTLTQIPIGVFFLISLPATIRSLFLGGDFASTGLFAVGMAGVILSLILGLRIKVWPCTASTLFTVFVMVIIRDLVRQAYLKPFFTPSSLEVNPQYGPLILFLAASAAGVTAVGFMIRLMLQNKGEVRS
ncbi:hypothetical protein ACFLZM_08665 [Thermodesulfobacteriota bacterium]